MQLAREVEHPGQRALAHQLYGEESRAHPRVAEQVDALGRGLRAGIQQAEAAGHAAT